jgi:hypothetical protein
MRRGDYCSKVKGKKKNLDNITMSTTHTEREREAVKRWTTVTIIIIIISPS